MVQMFQNIQCLNHEKLEITAVNQAYLRQQQLTMQILSWGFAWLDTGTHKALTEATEFVKAVQKRTGLKIACLVEIALHIGYLKKTIIKELTTKHVSKSQYFEYVKKVLK